MLTRVMSLGLVLLFAVAAAAQAPICLKTQPTGDNVTSASAVEFEAIFDQPVRVSDSAINFLGEPTGTPFNLRSEFRNALEFTSTSHRAISSGPVDLDGDYTVEFWFRTDLPGQIGIFSYAVPGQDNELTYFANGGVWSNNFFFGFAPAATVGRWHHVAIVRDTGNSRLKVYFDGVETNDFLSTTSNDANGSIVLGEDQDTLLGGFDPAQALIGAIDEVRIWNDIRTPSEIANSRFAQASGTAQGLAHYWRCNFTSNQGTSVPGSVDVADVSAAGETAFGLANGLALGNSRAPSTRHLVTLDTSAFTFDDQVRLRVTTGSSGGVTNETGQFLVSNPNGTPEADCRFQVDAPRTFQEGGVAPINDTAIRRELRFSEDVTGVSTSTVNVSGPAPGSPTVSYSVKSIFENALPLVGLGGYLRAPNFPFPNQGEMAVDFWFRTNNTSDACIFSYATTSQPNTLTIWADGRVFVDNVTVMPSCNMGQLDGGWHHMRITRTSAGTMYRYIDGVFAGLVSNADSAITDTTGYLVIGNDQDSFGGGFQASQALDGAIDEIRIWNDFDPVAFNSSEYMRPTNTSVSDLVAYWACEEFENLGVISATAVDDLRDLSGNGNHIDVQGSSSPSDMIDRGLNYVIDFDFSGSTRFIEYTPVIDGSIVGTTGLDALPTFSGEPAGSFVRIEDLICEVTINGGAPVYEEADLSGGDQVEIRMDSPDGTHDFVTTPLLLGQILPTGFEPATTVGFPEVRLGFGLSPAPFVIFDGGTSSPFGGGVMSPNGINISAIAPVGAGGESIVIQPVVQGASTANGIFAVGNYVLLNF